jgi:hypothetical protein
MSGHDPRDLNTEKSLTEPKSAPGKATPEHARSDNDVVGEVAGGYIGAVGGMSAGIAVAGPIGLLLGGLAGAVGGWWAGHGIAEALTHDDDAAFRADYELSAMRMADRTYDMIRPAYVAGQLAGRNPDYAGRTFEEIEPDLERGWNQSVEKQHGTWAAVRRYAGVAFHRERASRTKTR